MFTTTTNITNGNVSSDTRVTSIASRSSSASSSSSAHSSSISWRKTNNRPAMSFSNKKFLSSSSSPGRDSFFTRASSDPSLNPSSSSQSEASESSKEKTFGKNVDVEKYTIDQLAFLSRKEQGKKEGKVILPDYHNCTRCNGTGKDFCSACKGRGTNDHDITDDFESDVYIVGSTAEQWNLIKSTLGESTPCWLCRGKKNAICKDCRGTGCRDRDKLWVRV